MKKLKLNALEAKEMENVKGGYVDGGCFPHHNCGCGCYYANTGGSSTSANFNANAETGVSSPYRGDEVITLECGETL